MVFMIFAEIECKGTAFLRYMQILWRIFFKMKKKKEREPDDSRT